MNFTALKAELQARGFDQLSDTRLGQFINQGRAELDNAYLWPYRVATATGAAPLTISDLGVVQDVRDTANSSLPLDHRDFETLVQSYWDLSTTGTPLYFYIDNGVITTYPVGGTLSVRYFKRTPMLSGGTDTPLAPADYHMLIVDYAVRWASKDAEQPPTVDGDIQRQLAIMVDDLLGQQVQGPDAFQTAGAGSDDW